MHFATISEYTAYAMEYIGGSNTGRREAAVAANSAALELVG